MEGGRAWAGENSPAQAAAGSACGTNCVRSSGILKSLSQYFRAALAAGCALLLFARLTARAQPGGTPPPVKLAILPESSVSVAGDMLTVEMSKETNVTLLERAQIEKIRSEQALATGTSSYLELGRMLGADGMFVLEPVHQEGRDFLVARLIAVKPGVVVEEREYTWPLEDAGAWAQAARGQFQPWFSKLEISAGQALPLSVVNLHSSFSTDEEVELERELTWLLIDRLANEPEIFVLERLQLHNAASEKELQPEEESPFWTGKHLLDGIVDEEGFDPKTVTVTARLVSPRGESMTIQVAGPREDHRAVVEALVKKVLAALKRNPEASEWRPASEAGQFLEEARWAKDRRLYPQAQAASESAWALGLQTPEVAELRIRSYLQDHWLNTFIDPFFQPRWPDTALSPEGIYDAEESNYRFANPAKLTPAIRATALYRHDALLFKTNAAGLDKEWYDLGADLLSEADGLLDIFNFLAEARIGREDVIGELRHQTGQLAILLTSNAPPGADVNRSFSLDDLKWYDGSLWCERPEEALPLLRSVLKNGYFPKALPRIVAWNWDDRKRVPGLLKEFCAEVANSTNADLRLTGAYLELLRAPQGDELNAAEDRLAGAMRDEQQRLLTNRPLLSRICSTVTQGLEEKYYGSAGNSVNTNVFAGQLASALQELQADGFGRPAAPVTPRLTPRHVTAVPIEARFADWHELLPELAPDVQVVPVDAEWHSNTIWFHLRFHKSDSDYFGSFYRPGACWAAFVGVDEQTGRIQMIPFPKGVGLPDPNWTVFWSLPHPTGYYAITDDALVVSRGDVVEWYDFREKRWTEIRRAIPIGGGVAVVGRTVLVTTAENVFEVDPDNPNVRILASTRRRPPLNELDSLGGYHWLAPGPDGALKLVAGDHKFVFAPETHEFKEAGPYHFPPWPNNEARRIAPHGTEYGTIIAGHEGRRWYEFVKAYRDGTTNEELLLLQTNKTRAPAPPHSGGEPRRWNWPPTFPLQQSVLAFEGDALWCICPDESWDPLETNAAQAGTLIRFEPGSREGLQIPVSFMKDGKPIDPFGPAFTDENLITLMRRQPRPERMRPPVEVACFAMPHRLMFIMVPENGGLWEIPRESLEQRLAALKEAGAGAPGGTSPPGTQAAASPEKASKQ
jgi:hypothetical protein